MAKKFVHFLSKMAGDFESSAIPDEKLRSNSEDKESSSPESKCCGCVLVIWIIGKFAQMQQFCLNPQTRKKKSIVYLARHYISVL